MYILLLFLSALFVFVLAKTDKWASKKMQWQIEPEKYDSWFESTEGRKKIYMILLCCCIIPFVNGLVLAVSVIGLLIIFFSVLTGSNISKKLF